MTIEIHRPEREALIQEWMKRGAFPTVEDALMEALKSSPASGGAGCSRIERKTCSYRGRSSGRDASLAVQGDRP